MSPFWATAPIPSASELERECLWAARQVDEGSVSLGKKGARRAANLLFSLSRVSLADVRWNFFWPEVTRELQLRSGIGLAESDVAHLFRAWLGEAYEDRIDWDIHHKYVGLVFEQAGIGSGRNRIIKIFLEELVQALSSSPAESIEAGLAERTFKSFEESARRNDSGIATDIGPLKAVLIRAGGAVVDFASFVQRYPDKWNLRNLPWGRIKQIWEESSGTDPDTLTPSAQEVLEGIVSQLSSSITREEAFRGMLEGTLRLQLPGNLDADSVGDAYLLPVGQMQIRGVFGDLEVDVLDHPALASSMLSRLPRDEWKTLGKFYYRVSSEPFSAEAPWGEDVPAVPLFVRGTRGNPTQDGYYWGMECPDRARPTRSQAPERESHRRRPGSNRLFLDWTFLVTDGALKLRMRGFRGPLEISASSATLVVGGKDVWRGTLESGAPEDWSGASLSITPEQIANRCVTVALETEDDKYELNLSVSFLWQPAIVVFRTRVIREHSTYPVENAHENVSLYVEPGIKPELKNAHSSAGEPVVLAGRNLQRFSVKLFSAGFTSTVIRVRAREWRFNHSVPFRVETDIAAHTTFGDVKLDATEGLRVVPKGHSVEAVVVPATEWQTAPDYLRLHVGGGSALRMSIDPSNIVAGNGSWRVQVGRMLDSKGINISSELTFGIGAWDSPPDAWFTVLTVNRIDIESCRLNGESEIRIRTADGIERTVRSRDPVTPRSIGERKISVARLILQGGQAWFSWVPVVEDLMLAGRAGADCSYEINTTDAFPEQLAVTALGLPGSVWDLSLDKMHILVKSAETANLEDLLVSWRESTQGSVAVAEVAATNGQTSLTWRIRNKVTVESVVAGWVEHEDSFPAILINATLLAICPEAITLRVRSAGNTLAVESARLPEPRGVGRRQISAKLVVPPVSMGHERGSLVAEIECRDIVISSTPIDAAQYRDTASGHAPEVTERGILEALNQYRRTGREVFADHALLLIAEYSATHRRLPHGEARLLAPIMGSIPTPENRSRKILIDSIRMIGSLANGGTVEIVPEYGGKDLLFLRAISASLMVFHQDRAGLSGLMAPGEVRRACDDLRLLEAEGLVSWRPWCHSVIGFASDSLARYASVEQSMSKIKSLPERIAGRSLTIAALYPPFARWINRT